MKSSDSSSTQSTVDLAKRDTKKVSSAKKDIKKTAETAKKGGDKKGTLTVNKKNDQNWTPNVAELVKVSAMNASILSVLQGEVNTIFNHLDTVI